MLQMIYRSFGDHTTKAILQSEQTEGLFTPDALRCVAASCGHWRRVAACFGENDAT